MLTASTIFFILLSAAIVAATIYGFGFTGEDGAHRVFDFWDTIMTGVSAWLRRTSGAWCELETVAPYRLVEGDEATPLYAAATRDGSLMTLIRIRGTSTIDGDEELAARIRVLDEALAAYFNKPGYVVQFGGFYDPKAGNIAIDHAQVAARAGVDRLNLDLGFLLDDQRETLSRFISYQEFYVAVWTTPAVLTKVVAKQSGAARAKATAQTLNGRNAQNVSAAHPSLRDMHRAFVNSMVSNLRNADVLSEVVDAHIAMRVLRKRTAPNSTSWNWRAVLPGDRLPLRADGAKDFSDGLYPKLVSQLFPEPFDFIGEDFLAVRGRTYAFVHMQLWPQNPRKFEILFKALASNAVPYGLNITLGSSAARSMSVGIKSFLASVLSKLSSDNKRYHAAVQDLRARTLDGQTLVTAQLTFCTWIDGSEDLDLLRSRQATLSSLVQDWGAADASQGIGDPGMAFASSFPGFMRASSAPAAIAPLHEIIRMFPLDMPTAIFDEGNYLLRSGSQILPYVQGSSKQAAMVDATFSPMGGGKSMSQNAYNLAFILQGENLPYLSIIDIGRSSQGLIRLVQRALPPSKRHLAVFERLRFEDRFSINVLDLPLGIQAPLPLHAAFLTRFITQLCGDQKTGETDEAIPGLATACVKAAYHARRQDQTPKRYRPGISAEIDSAIRSMALEIMEYTTWWDIRDRMFDHGHEHLAIQATLQAVPVLQEVATMAHDPMVAGQYKKVVNGEPITTFFFRKMTEAISRIPLLTRPTQFNIGGARVVSLDLDEVSPRSDGWTSAIMYMLGLRVGSGHFFQYAEDVKLFEPLYQAYQRRRIQEIIESPKRLYLDEFHRVSRNGPLVDQVAKDIETNVREGRKWNLHIGFASQVLDDIPDVMMSLTQTRFIMGLGDYQDLGKIAAKFGLRNSAQRAVTHIGSPSSAGANMVAVYRMGDREVVQFCTLTLGPLMRWAFSSTAEERELRDRLYEVWDVRKTLEALASRYPRNGMLKQEIDERKALFGETGLNRDADESIAKAIFREITGITREMEAM